MSDDKPHKRVYQGGHHDVWCDGEIHIRCEGGFVMGSLPQAPITSGRGFMSRGKCDCAKWAAGNGWAA